MNDFFTRFANRTAHLVGHRWAFVAAVVVVLLWAVLGPAFGYSDTWQLVINTSTTIVTFLVVFLIQNTQNRDARAIHLKLDELIRAVKDARNDMIDIEDVGDDKLAELAQQYAELREVRDASFREHVTKTAAEVAEQTARKVADESRASASDDR